MHLNEGCSKATWGGCGMHIDSVLKGIDETDRCPGWMDHSCPFAKGACRSRSVSDIEISSKEECAIM